MWSRRFTLALCAGPLAAGAASAADLGRMDLLAREAADVLAPAAVAAPGGALGFLGAVLLSAVLASILGTWIGLRSRSVTRIRERNGWRELSYRFRAAEPLKADANLISRLAGVLDDLEDLGRRLRPGPLPATAGVPAGVLTAEDLQEPVRFRRADGVEGVRARWTPGPAPETTPARPPRPEPSATVSAPVATAPPASRGEPIVRDRSTSYREARRLLREGHDRQTVRARTGLKLAEIDLLRCTPGDAS